MHDLLKNFPVVIELPVLWGDMDALAHVNNVIYFRYMESARVAYFGEIKFGRPDQSDIGPILGSARCRFRIPLAHPDTISVGARVTDVQSDRFTMEHVIVSHKLNAIAAEGDGIIVSFNYRENKKAALPEPVRKKIEEIEARIKI